MNGPFYLLILAGMIFLLWKYSGHAKKAIAGVGKVTNGLKNGAASFKNISMILFCVALLLFWWFYSSSWKSPGLAEVVEWKNAYWLPILVGLAIVYALAGYATTVTEVARAIVLAVAFMLFIGFPVWVWVTGPSTTPRATRVEVPLASSPQSSWSKLAIPALGRSEQIPVPPGMKAVMAGNRFVLHTVYVDGRDCSFKESGICPPGAYAGIYAVNEAEETNTVSYAFAPI